MKKRTPIDLQKLGLEAASELNAMVAELHETSDTQTVPFANRFGASGKVKSGIGSLNLSDESVAQWTKRFAASGKTKCHLANSDFIEDSNAPRFTRRFSASGKILPAPPKIRD